MKSIWKLVSSSFSNSTGVSLYPAKDEGEGSLDFTSSISSAAGLREIEQDKQLEKAHHRRPVQLARSH